MKGSCGKGFKGKGNGIQIKSWKDHGAQGAGIRSIPWMERRGPYHGAQGAGGLGVGPLDPDRGRDVQRDGTNVHAHAARLHEQQVRGLGAGRRAERRSEHNGTKDERHHTRSIYTGLTHARANRWSAAARQPQLSSDSFRLTRAPLNPQQLAQAHAPPAPQDSSLRGQLRRLQRDASHSEGSAGGERRWVPRTQRRKHDVVEHERACAQVSGHDAQNKEGLQIDLGTLLEK